MEEIELEKNILNYLYKEENKSNKPYVYYSINEYGINDKTNFNWLSSKNQILLKSKCTHKTATIILNIFENAYEDSYTIFRTLLNNLSEENIKYYKNIGFFKKENYKEFIAVYLKYANINKINMYTIIPIIEEPQQIFTIKDILIFLN